MLVSLSVPFAPGMEWSPARFPNPSASSVFSLPSTHPAFSRAVEGSASQPRLRRWLNLLISIKRKYALDDPELFATYVELAGEARDVVRAHVDRLTEQITQIISDGIAQGEFATDDPFVVGRAVLTATTLFHDPAHVAEWSDPDIDAAFDGIWSLILVGLRPRNIAQ